MEWVGEDYTRIEKDASGEDVSITRQRLNYVEKGKTEVQFLVGRRAGDPFAAPQQQRHQPSIYE